MDMRITEQELADKILRAIQTKTPFAVARYGDGEYAVANPCDLTEMCYIKHLGFIPESRSRRTISNLVKDSIHGLDVIGITTLTTGYWGDSRVYFEGLAEQPIVSLDFHTYFNENHITEKLIRSADKLLYISGHTINFGRFKNLKDIIRVEIPLQHCKYPNQKPYWPDYFNFVMKFLSKKDLTGYLCFVGAGFIGKPFMMTIKNQGGIAVDFGSNMDRLAGYVIRGAKGKTATPDNTYKL
jgi:hypothetical protein